MADDRGTDFWSSVLGLFRRTAVVVPAVITALALGFAAFLATPQAYVSSTTMVLTATEYGSTASPGPLDPTELSNPLLNFNDSLRTTSAMLIQSMNTKDVETRLNARGPTKLTVDDGRSNPELLSLNGPFVYVLGQSTTPEESERVVREAQAMLRATLRDWQRSMSAPEKTYVGLVDVVAPTTPERDRGQAVKLGIAAAGFGFLLVMVVAYARHRPRAGAPALAVAA